jgi:hypothetical protein
MKTEHAKCGGYVAVYKKNYAYGATRIEAITLLLGSFIKC